MLNRTVLLWLKPVSFQALYMYRYYYCLSIFEYKIMTNFFTWETRVGLFWPVDVTPCVKSLQHVNGCLDSTNLRELSCVTLNCFRYLSVLCGSWANAKAFSTHELGTSQHCYTSKISSLGITTCWHVASPPGGSANIPIAAEVLLGQTSPCFFILTETECPQL